MGSAEVIVLDTHTLVWWLDTDRSRIPQSTHDLIEAELTKGEVLVSSISAWELALLVTRNKIDLTVDLFAWLDAAAKIDGLRFVPVDTLVAAKSVTLPGDFHADPADRIIVALAREVGAPLVTADEKIRRYPHVKTIW